jgi:hypothetical protein
MVTPCRLDAYIDHPRFISNSACAIIPRGRRQIAGDMEWELEGIGRQTIKCRRRHSGISMAFALQH